MLRTSRKNNESELPVQREDVTSGPAATFIAMTTWQKRDWQQFYQLARRPWRRHRPPRPVYPSGLNRVAPAQGYSLSELDDAGVDLDLAEALGLPETWLVDKAARSESCPMDSLKDLEPR